MALSIYTAYGRLVADAQMINSRTDAISFRVAIDTRKKEQTIFMSCSKWGTGADTLFGYLKKGREVIVTGELSPYSYSKKDGTQVEGLQLTCSNVQLVGKKEDPDNSEPSPYTGQQNNTSGDCFDDADIPF